MSDSSFVTKNFSEATSEKLQESLSFLKKEMFSLRFQKAYGELFDSSSFRKTRKDIARINTELNKRKNIGVK